MGSPGSEFKPSWYDLGGILPIKLRLAPTQVYTPIQKWCGRLPDSKKKTHLQFNINLTVVILNKKLYIFTSH
jgi:hypothetical protein